MFTNMQPEPQKIEQLKQEVAVFLYENQEFKIGSADEYTKAGDVIKEIKQRLNKLDDKCKEYTKPLNDLKSKIIADFRQISDPLEKFVEEVKDMMTVWYRAEQKRLDEEQSRIEAEALKKAKDENKSEVQVPVVNMAAKTQRGDFSTTTVKKVWRWRILDETKVPRQYLCVNSPAVVEAIRGGARNIDGLEIYQDEQISIR